jgi:hypothetical protein
MHPLAVMQRKVTNIDKAGENQVRLHASTSNLSISSTASSNLPSFFDDDDEEEEVEDWTQSVLLAADVDGKWTLHKPSSPS